MTALKTWIVGLVGVLALVGGAGCTSVDAHRAALHSNQERELTLGVVQRDVAVGMGQDEVAMALGSPNIVTKDRDGVETWIYDKIATERSYSQSGTSAGAVVGVAGSSRVAGGAGGGVGYTRAAGASSTSQRTLTVVIKYDADGRVQSVDYHSSRF